MTCAATLRAAVVAIAIAAAATPMSAAAQAPAAPNAVTGTVDEIGQTIATVRGSVDPNGAPTTYVFEYGTSSLNQRTERRSAGSGTGAVNVAVQLGGLRPGTSYRYRLVATSEGGTAAGAVRSFRTDPAPAALPIAATGAARDVTQTSATLTGAVNNRGRDATYLFQYGPTARYGASTPSAPLGPSTSALNVSAPIGGLAPDTVYHYRLVMQVGPTTIRGRDRSFRTAKEPNGLLLQASDNPVRYGGATDAFGLLAGSANAGRTIHVQADPYPFGDGWATIASGRTDATGAYRIAVTPLLLTTQLRTVADTSPAVISQPLTVAVRVQTSLRVSDRRVRRGDRVRFRGSVQPAQPGASVSIQRKGGDGDWHTIARTRQQGSGARSTYSRRVRLFRSGRYRAVARANDGAHVMDPSRGRYIRVRR